MKKHLLITAVSAMVFVIGCAAAANAQDTGMKKYTLADGRMSVELPAEPTLEKFDEEGVLTLTYSSETDETLVSVTEVSYTDGVEMNANNEFVMSMLDAFFQGLEQELAKSGDYEADAIEEVEFAGMKGKEQAIRISGMPMIARGFAVNGRLYFIGVMAPDEAQILKVLNTLSIASGSAAPLSAK